MSAVPMVNLVVGGLAVAVIVLVALYVFKNPDDR